jgi:Spy/CpxP family protein refolding chaperone
VRRWGLAIALLLSLGMNAGILAMLWTGKARGRQFMERPRAEAPLANLERFADRLELEGETRQRFLEIQRRFFETTREERRRLQGLRAELRRALTDRDSDRAAVDRILAEMAAVQPRLDRALVDNVLATRELLPPTQERRFLRHLAFLVRPRAGQPPPRRPPSDSEGEVP